MIRYPVRGQIKYPILGPVSVPPEPGLLEGFEHIIGNLPTGGPLTWNGVGIYTLLPSVLHVTQGTKSGLYTDSGIGNGLLSTDPVDLSAYNTISIDVYVAVTGAQQKANLTVQGDSTYTDLSPGGAMGAYTLSVDITDDPSKSTMVIQISGNDGGEILYWDNLRGAA